MNACINLRTCVRWEKVARVRSVQVTVKTITGISFAVKVEERRSRPKPMKEIRLVDYARFLVHRKSVSIGGKKIPLEYRDSHIERWGPPEAYHPESYTVWSFPDRGDWATHDGGYRGNWSPYIPRNLIQRFTAPGDVVLDPMMGSGTTLVECRLLGREGIGIDVNLNAVMLARSRLAFRLPPELRPRRQSIRTYLGDARRMNKLPDESVDLVATHPPYASIIRYGGGAIEGDLSEIPSFDGYLESIGNVAAECYRVLTPGKHCAVLVGDTRRHRHYVPISYSVMREFVRPGFLLLEDIIKLQHNTASDRSAWRGDRSDFYKIAHEHLFVFRKPLDLADARRVALSTSAAWGRGELSNSVAAPHASSMSAK